MKILSVSLFLVFILMQTCILGAVSFEQLIEASEKFNKNTCSFPTSENRIKQIARTKKDQDKIELQANSVQVIADLGIQKLAEDFLKYKKKFGSKIEQGFYKNMTLLEFFKRLIKKRPLVFYTKEDIYRLQEKNIKGEGCFENIGTPCEIDPLVLSNYLSYDEMQIAALLGVATPTFFINNGHRCNKAILERSEDFQKEGIYIGLVGARFEKPNCMEWQHMIITPEQNTIKNGYGLSKKESNIWEKFYDEKLPTFQEAKNNNFGKYLKLSENLFLNISVYKKRIKFVVRPFLKEADNRAKALQKKAYCRVVGLGLGVWKIANIQENLMIEAYQEILREEIFEYISDIEFLYFNESLFKLPEENRIHISFSKANPANKLQGADKEKLLVAMYAWDGNSYPGNEYWDGNLTGSGDPAAACCSTIAELQNPLINPVVLKSCEKLIYMQ